MTVESILVEGREVISCAPGTALAEVVKTLVDNRIGAILVLDGETVAGILSERDIVRCLAEQGAGAFDKCARDLMTTEVETTRPDESVHDAMSHMTRRRFRHLPVMDGKRLVGIVSIGDLVKARIMEAEREAESLKTYIQHA